MQVIKKNFKHKMPVCGSQRNYRNDNRDGKTVAKIAVAGLPKTQMQVRQDMLLRKHIYPFFSSGDINF
jgi:hypothetical protein